MRLIDADAPDLGHCKGGEVCGVVFVRLNDVALAIKNTPTIDPIHAVGGCRCAECKFASADGGYEYPGQAETHVNCTIRLTRNHRAVIMPKDGHCSCGERKDGKKHDNQ